MFARRGKQNGVQLVGSCLGCCFICSLIYHVAWRTLLLTVLAGGAVASFAKADYVYADSSKHEDDQLLEFVEDEVCSLTRELFCIAYTL